MSSTDILNFRDADASAPVQLSPRFPTGRAAIFVLAHVAFILPALVLNGGNSPPSTPAGDAVALADVQLKVGQSGVYSTFEENVQIAVTRLRNDANGSACYAASAEPADIEAVRSGKGSVRSTPASTIHCILS